LALGLFLLPPLGRPLAQYCAARLTDRRATSRQQRVKDNLPEHFAVPLPQHVRLDALYAALDGQPMHHEFAGRVEGHVLRQCIGGQDLEAAKRSSR
jgi:hypothetical protein